jgi:hypothetical protein
MKTRLITTLAAITLAAFAGTSARADESGVTLEWQQPGYVMDVIVVTAPRPQIAALTEEVEAAATEEVALAWQQPGYVQEVVIAKASRSEVLAQARRAAIEAALARDALFRSGASWTTLGTPTR